VDAVVREGLVAGRVIERGHADGSRGERAHGGERRRDAHLPRYLGHVVGTDVEDEVSKDRVHRVSRRLV
jgi:hypothetical protein